MNSGKSANGVRSDRDRKATLSKIKTKSGVSIDATLDVWSYRDGVNDVSLDFNQLPGTAHEFVESSKGVLSWYAENRSPDHLKNMFRRLQHFLRTIERVELFSIAAVDLLNYKASLNESRAWYLGNLAGLLRKWHALGHPGVDDDAMQLLSQLRIKGNTKGVSVLTLDPHDGPFTHLEAEALHASLHNAHATGKLSMAEYVLAWLYVLLGQRNKQHAALKVCDVKVSEPGEIPVKYSILMPSAKNRAKHPRAALVERPLVEQFGEVLAAYAASVRARFESVLPDPLKAPLFPTTKPTRSAPGFEFHRTSADIGQTLVTAIEDLYVVSERTGKPMSVSAVRFRRTIGTRAAEEGLSPLVIARLLDHTDTQQVGVYSANSPAIVDRIDRAIALEMAPLAQAFAGVLLSRQDASPDTSRRIIDLRIDRSGTPMGDCGKHGFCGFNAPIACYTCVSFQAWDDGPHEAVLEHLLHQRERRLKISDKRIAAINDRTIYAVAAVVKRCREVRALPNPAE